MNRRSRDESAGCGRSGGRYLRRVAAPGAGAGHETSPSPGRAQVWAASIAFLLALLPAVRAAAQSHEVVPVVSRRVERILRLPGEILPYQQVGIAARVTGFVESVDVDRGSRVRKGDALVVLSAPEMAARLAESESNAQVFKSRKAEADAKIQGLEIALRHLKDAAATPGAVAANEVDQSEKALAAARAVRSALDDAAAAAAASVVTLRDLQGYLRIRAPFDGVITERLVHPGALVGPGGGVGAGPLLRLEQTSRLRLILPVPETAVEGIARGESVSFTVPAYPGESFKGIVARIAGSLEARTRTMPVELDVANPQGRLAPGMYPEALWPLRRGPASLLVPSSSVVTTTERTFVIRVRGNRAEWVNVARGYPVGELVEVFGALAAGDEVLRRGTDEVRENATVRVLRPSVSPPR
jgi:membrane fusion protein, multidrug efflux system